MKLDSLISDSVKAFGSRFNLIGLLPNGVLCLFLLALAWSGAPDHAPDLQSVAHRVTDLRTAEAVVLGAGILSLALALQPLQLAMVRILEGYWGNTWPAERAAAACIFLHRRQRRKWLAAQQSSVPLDLAEKGHAATAAWALRQNYPPEDKVLPTRLGNVLRAAEDRAGRRYGLDAVAIWPRLYPLLGEKLAMTIADQRDQLDLSARFCAVFFLAAIAAGTILFRHGAWLLVPGAALLLAWLSYRAAIAAAIVYGESIEAAFDLYRFDLLTALHLPLPCDRATERAANEALCDFLRQGVPTNFDYKHAPKDSKPIGVNSPSQEV
jgi:hypothetical protein